MSDPIKAPMVMLAFANGSDAYLQMIEKEREGVYRALQDRHDRGFMQVHKQENTSIDDLFEQVDRYRDRIVIFHYGGHASGSFLQLEADGHADVARAEGVAQLLGQQKGLQLVFLNGCATRGQVDMLLAQGVKAVIATERPVDDALATGFALQFYESLASGATVARAFAVAKAYAAAPEGGSQEVRLTRSLAEFGRRDRDAPMWGLHLNDGADDVLEWRLPEHAPPPLTRLHERRAAPKTVNELLLTDRRALGLVGRQAEMAKLAAWRAGSDAVAVCCLTGRSGSGKTRLAIEACEAAEAAGWTAGFASGQDGVADIHKTGWLPSSPTLIVVDDAGLSTNSLKAWFAALAPMQRARRPPLRILLLERAASSDYGWWKDLKERSDDTQEGAADLLADETPMELAALAAETDQRELFGEAVNAAAAILGRPAIPLPPPGVDPKFDEALGELDADNEPLFLMMAAIQAVEHGAVDALNISKVDLAERMAQIERSQLQRLSESRGLGDRGALLAHLAACVTVQNGCALDALAELVAEELRALGVAIPWPWTSETLAEVLLEDLPLAGDHVEGIKPYLIGEAFLVKEFLGPRTRSQATRDAIICRAAARDAMGVVATLSRAAQDLAAGDIGHSAYAWLALMGRRSENPDTLGAIADAVRGDTPEFRALEIEIRKRAVELWRPVAQEHPDWTARFGWALFDLGRLLLRSAGPEPSPADLELAARVFQEAAGIYRSRAEETSEPIHLAMAGIALGGAVDCLCRLKRDEEALALAQEEVEVAQRLRAQAPDENPLAVSNAARHQWRCLALLDRREEALQAAQMAAEASAAIAQAEPREYGWALVSNGALLAGLLMADGHYARALEWAETALGLFRRQDASPRDCLDEFVELAKAECDALLCLGRDEAATAAMLDIAAMLRGAMEGVEGEAARALALATVYILKRAAMRTAADPQYLDLAVEVADLQRRFVADPQDRAGGLNRLALCRLAVNDVAGALEALEEAAALLSRPPAEPEARSAWADQLGDLLSDLAETRERAGDAPGAAAATEQLAAHRRAEETHGQET